MPRLAPDDLDQHTTTGAAGTFGFSAVKMDRLGASVYTLVTVVVDESGSVGDFAAAIEKCLGTAFEACLLSPYADNVLLRVVAFNDAAREVHGFVPLKSIDPAAYRGAVRPGGTTALHATLAEAVAATAAYAATLTAGAFEVNAAVFCLTDGMNNCPPMATAPVRDALRAAVKGEQLGTLTTVLVGINDQAEEHHGGRRRKVGDVLAELKDEAGLTSYIGLTDTSPKTLARLAAFIQASVSSVSKAAQSPGGARSVPAPVTF